MVLLLAGIQEVRQGLCYLHQVQRHPGKFATSQSSDGTWPRALTVTGSQTKLDIDKKGKVVMKCKACAHKAPVDNTHKVVKEIIKYPPGTERKNSKKDGDKKPKAGKNYRRSCSFFL